MARVSVRAFEDRSRSEGGHAAVVLRGVSRLPGRITFRLSPTDADAASHDAEWAGETFAPLASRLTDEGVLLTIGPELADSPDLLPGTAVLIEVPELGVEGEFLWPSITPLARPRRRGLVVAKGGRGGGTAKSGGPRHGSIRGAGAAGKPMHVGQEPKHSAAGVETPPAPDTGLGTNSRQSAVRLNGGSRGNSQSEASGRSVAEPTRVGAVEPAALAATKVAVAATAARSVVVPLPARARAEETALRTGPGKVGLREGSASTATADTVAASSAVAPATAGAERIEKSEEANPALSDASKKEGDRWSEADATAPAELVPPAARRGFPRTRTGAALLTALVLLLAQAGALAVLAPDMAQSALVRLLPTALEARLATSWPGAARARDLPPPLTSLLMVAEVSPRGVMAHALPAYRALELASERLTPGPAADAEEGAYWLRRYLLATLGSEPTRRALTRLGVLEAEGHGRPADAAAARHLWEFAARAGDELAMCFLARLLADGVGVAADPSLARAWRERAGQSCSPTAVPVPADRSKN
jgi:hypothetical protein